MWRKRFSVSSSVAGFDWRGDGEFAGCRTLRPKADNPIGPYPYPQTQQRRGLKLQFNQAGRNAAYRHPLRPGCALDGKLLQARQLRQRLQIAHLAIAEVECQLSQAAQLRERLQIAN